MGEFRVKAGSTQAAAAGATLLKGDAFYARFVTDASQVLLLLRFTAAAAAVLLLLL